MPPRLLFAVLCCAAVNLAGQGLTAEPEGHRLAVFGGGKLAIVERDGRVSWEIPWKALHDLHPLPNGNLLAQRGYRELCEIDVAAGQVVWSYDCGTANGNAGRRVELHAFQPLAEEKILLAESGPSRLIEIDRRGTLLKTIPLRVNQPHPHRDTRLARRLANGHTLVCHEGDGAVREYDPQGAVVWEYDVPLFGQSPRPGHGPEAFGNQVFSALRLPNGHTLIGTGNGHSVLEVTPAKEIVWQVRQNDLPGVTLAWVTTLEVLPNGNVVIGNCHAGPDNPVLVEVTRRKQVVWTYDGYPEFGNDVSNSAILGEPTLR